MQAAGAGERAGAARAAGRSALEQEAVVGAAEQLVLPQRELVAGQQLAAAHGTAETLDVVHAVPRPHHQIAAAEAHLALGALDAEEPAGPRHGRWCQHGACGRPRLPGCYPPRAHAPRTLCGPEGGCGDQPSGGSQARRCAAARVRGWGPCSARAGARGRPAILEPRPQRAVAQPGLSRASPDVIPLAVGLPVSHEARARLVQVLAALGALEAGGVPLEVGRHPQDKLVVDLTPAAHAHGRPGLLCRGRARGPRQAWLPGPRPRPLQPQPNPLALSLSFKNCDHKKKEMGFP